MKRSTTLRLTVFAAAVATSLLFTFSAFAATRPDDRSGLRGPDVVTAATQVGGGGPGLASRPDNRAGILGAGTASTIERSVSAGSSRGFDWAAAGIGAGVTGGALMLLGAAALIAVPKRHGRVLA